jgi:hypothetical protein
MVSHAVEPIRSIPTAARRRRVAARPGGISTKPMLLSLLCLSSVAAAALFWVHAQVVGVDASASQRLGVTELQATAAPIEIPPPPAWTPAAALTPTPSSRTSVAAPSAILARPRTVPAAPLSRPPPKAQAASLAPRQALDAPSNDRFGTRP